MPEIGEQNPLNPLHPVNPARRLERRQGSKERPGQGRGQRKDQPEVKDDDGKPHIDEYA